MKTSNIQNIHAKSAVKGSTLYTPGSSPKACGVKQMTEQLELALEHIYQLTLELPRQAKRLAKKIPHIPAYIQLLLDFTAKPAKSNPWSTTKLVIFSTVAILSAFSIGFLIS